MRSRSSVVRLDLLAEDELAAEGGAAGKGKGSPAGKGDEHPTLAVPGAVKVPAETAEKKGPCSPNKTKGEEHSASQKQRVCTPLCAHICASPCV